MKTLVATAIALMLLASGASAKLAPLDSKAAATQAVVPDTQEASRREADYFRAPQSRSVFERIAPCGSQQRPQTVSAFLQQRKACN
jgi:hypothetical protein